LSQSKLTISAVDYNLYIQKLTENHNCIISEKELVPDSASYTYPNSTIITSGNYRKRYTISGYTDLTNWAIFRAAYKAGTSCEANLYGPGNSSTNLSGEDFIISKFSTSYKMGDDTVWFNMELMQAEAINYETGGYGYGVGPYGDYGYGW